MRKEEKLKAREKRKDILITCSVPKNSKEPSSVISAKKQRKTI